MPLSLAEIFPDEDYRFHLTLRQASVREYFSARDPQILEERRRWLAATPGRYVGAVEGAEANVADFESALGAWVDRPVPTGGDTASRLVQIGGELEPDIVLLAADSLRVRAGIVCFPSSWALEEKLGRTMAEIHGPVPGLNRSLGVGIERFLERLKPGIAYERANWGLAATAELNMHPALERPRIGQQPSADALWVRIEDQLLTVVERTIVFGIHVRVLPLAALLRDSVAATGFRRALRTMPAEVAQYKGIAAARDALCRL